MAPRGGKREGSGRRKLGDEPRVHISVTVDARTAEALQAMAKAENVSLGVVLDRLVRDPEPLQVPVPVAFESPAPQAPVPSHPPVPAGIAPLELEDFEEEPSGLISEVPGKAAQGASVPAPQAPEKAAQVAPKPVAWPKATKEELTVNGGVITQAIIDTFKKCAEGHDLDWAFVWAKASWGKDIALRLLDLFKWHKI